MQPPAGLVPAPPSRLFHAPYGLWPFFSTEDLLGIIQRRICQSDYGLSVVATRSIFLRQKQCRHRAIRFRDDPQPEATVRAIRTLSDLVASYEDDHHAIEPASDADMLRHLMEAKGVTQNQLSQGTEIAKSTISELLSGKKPFSRQIIRKLANYFNVAVSVLASNL